MRSITFVGVFLLSLALAVSIGRAESPAVTDPAMEELLADAETAPELTAALRCRDSGDDDAALAHLRRANAAVKKKHGPNNLQQLPILEMAGEILFVGGRYAEAVTPFERSVAIREPLAAEDNADQKVAMASTLLLLGKAYAETGNAGNAVSALTRAVDLFSATLGEDHEATQVARRALATASTGKGAG
jgi:tetratricopeptide (TPR) repeat protein